jgi:hypothetical protein
MEGTWRAPRRVREFLGSNALTLEIDKAYREYRLRIGHIDGLYAIVIPSGGGKTTLAREYGMLDIDDVVNAEYMDDVIMPMRYEAFKNNDAKLWVRHNDVWYAAVHEALLGMDLREGKVILVHTPEIGYAIGAKVIGVLLPSERLHKHNIRERSVEQRALAELNYRTILSRKQKGTRVHVFDSMTDLQMQAVLWASSVSVVAHPMKNTLRYYDLDLSQFVPVGYEGAPDWAKFGWYDEVELDECISYVRMGIIPPITLERYCKAKQIQNTFLDVRSSWSFTRWIQISSAIMCSIREPEKIPPDPDYFQLFPPASKLNVQRANVNMRRLLSNIDLSNYSRRILEHHVGDSQHFVVALIVYYEGIIRDLPDAIRTRVELSGMLLVREEDWITIHTEIHNLVRLTSTLFDTELDANSTNRLMYTNSLYGRRPYEIGGEEEVDKRQEWRIDVKRAWNGSEWTLPQYWRDFKSAVTSVYKNLGERRRNHRFVDFPDFWRKRFEVITKGSLTIASDVFKEPNSLMATINSATERILIDPNKRSAMERKGVYDAVLDELFLMYGYNPTKVASKPNEPAKKRVLLPGSFAHFIAVSYILTAYEMNGEMGCIGLNSDGDMIRHFDTRISDAGFKFMYDFADHNAQHSVFEMAYLFEALPGMMGTDEATFEYFKDWVKESFLGMSLIDESGEHALNSGLFTGWRCTTWINTVLNNVYMNIALMSYQRLYGTNPILSYEGEGDDVDIVMASAADVVRFYDVCYMCGFEATDIKQLMSKEQHEFLRITYKGGTYRACINRALPGYICGDLERGGANAPQRLMSNWTTIQMMKRRGLSSRLCRVLCDVSKQHWGRLVTDEGYITIPDHYIHGIQEQGGMGIPDQNGKLWVMGESLPDVFDVDAIRFETKDCFATEDYVSVVRGELSREGIALNVPRNVVREMAVASLDADSVTRAVVGHIDVKDVARTFRRPVTIVRKEDSFVESKDSDYEVGFRGLIQFLRSGGDRLARVELNKLSRYKGLLSYTEDKEVAVRKLAPNCIEPEKALNIKFNIYDMARLPEWVASEIKNKLEEEVAMGMEVDVALEFSKQYTNAYLAVFPACM